MGLMPTVSIVSEKPKGDVVFSDEKTRIKWLRVIYPADLEQFCNVQNIITLIKTTDIGSVRSVSVVTALHNYLSYLCSLVGAIKVMSFGGTWAKSDHTVMVLDYEYVILLSKNHTTEDTKLRAIWVKELLDVANVEYVVSNDINTIGLYKLVR